jgi:hypothetical protein
MTRARIVAVLREKKSVYRLYGEAVHDPHPHLPRLPIGRPGHAVAVFSNRHSAIVYFWRQLIIGAIIVIPIYPRVRSSTLPTPYTLHKNPSTTRSLFVSFISSLIVAHRHSSSLIVHRSAILLSPATFRRIGFFARSFVQTTKINRHQPPAPSPNTWDLFSWRLFQHNSAPRLKLGCCQSVLRTCIRWPQDRYSGIAATTPTSPIFPSICASASSDLYILFV